MADPLRSDQPQDYQDDLDTEGVDRATHELTDDPAEELQVPASELRGELDNLDGVASDPDDREFVEEDMREQVEDIGEDGERKN